MSNNIYDEPSVRYIEDLVVPYLQETGKKTLFLDMQPGALEKMADIFADPVRKEMFLGKIQFDLLDYFPEQFIENGCYFMIMYAFDQQDPEAAELLHGAPLKDHKPEFVVPLSTNKKEAQELMRKISWLLVDDFKMQGMSLYVLGIPMAKVIENESR